MLLRFLSSTVAILACPALALLSTPASLAQSRVWTLDEPPAPGESSALRWEPVREPTGAVGVDAAAGAAPAAEAAQIDPAASLAWELVPASEVIDPEAAVAEALAAPDPDILPEPEPQPTQIRGLARGITVNGNPFPDAGLFVPNGFAMDPEFTVSAILDGVNRTRSCRVGGETSASDCADAVAYLEITPFKGERASLGFQWAVQSLSGRNEGTSQFAAQSLGFRTAVNLTPTTGLAFGGEHILQLDSSTDLGRNFYLVFSQAIPLGEGPNGMWAVGTVGIGSDFYGYGNTSNRGSLGSTNCLSGNNISSPTFPTGTDCYWAAIGSIQLYLNSRVSIGAEWFGYGFGAGISVRPIDAIPLTLSLYATDFLGNRPDYIASFCSSDPCETRYYGKMTLSF